MRAALGLCLLLALRGVDARRKLRQSDESGETGDAAPGVSSELTAGYPPPARPPVPPIMYPPHVEVSGTSLVVKMLYDYPEAVCNDGTPGGYYWSKGTDPSLWVVYLQGGACLVAARCLRRAGRETPCARFSNPTCAQDTGAPTGSPATAA